MIEQLKQIEQEMTQIRRYFHENPELSFQEVNTPSYISKYLEKLGVEHETKVGGRGVVAKIKGTGEGKTVALRADFDALPIQDEKDVPYTSKVPGIMHACGHDAHTAALLGVANVASRNRDKFKGEIRLIFQHAEELSPGGAISMVKDGCLKGVDAIFGVHVASDVPTGIVGYGYGPVMANADDFTIEIQGKGGHAATPHVTIDPIVIGSSIVSAFQQIVSRRINPLEPAVISVCKFIAGSAFNIIPDTALLEGTVRTYSEEVQEFIIKEMEEIVKIECEKFGGTYNFRYGKGYPAVINHEEETTLFKEILEKQGKKTEVKKPKMGGEDFSYYLKEKPGAFFFVGSRNEEKNAAAPHHHPKFDIDEDAILHCAEGLLGVALAYLEK
ncbi:MAG: M20 family metallopeptidase [Defluviitaleaceae bacterium]|nr:M20 family metallopeptidase [Defluviitaleaceae bacterium]